MKKILDEIFKRSFSKNKTNTHL